MLPSFPILEIYIKLFIFFILYFFTSSTGEIEYLPQELFQHGRIKSPSYAFILLLRCYWMMVFVLEF